MSVLATRAYQNSLSFDKYAQVFLETLKYSVETMKDEYWVPTNRMEMKMSSLKNDLRITSVLNLKLNDIEAVRTILSYTPSLSHLWIAIPPGMDGKVFIDALELVKDSIILLRITELGDPDEQFTEDAMGVLLARADVDSMVMEGNVNDMDEDSSDELSEALSSVNLDVRLGTISTTGIVQDNINKIPAHLRYKYTWDHGYSDGTRVKPGTFLSTLKVLQKLRQIELELPLVYNSCKELLWCKNIDYVIIDKIQDMYSLKYILLLPKIETLIIKDWCGLMYYSDPIITKVPQHDHRGNIRYITQIRPKRYDNDFDNLIDKSTLQNLIIVDVSKVLDLQNAHRIKMLRYNISVAKLDEAIENRLTRGKEFDKYDDNQVKIVTIRNPGM